MHDSAPDLTDYEPLNTASKLNTVLLERQGYGRGTMLKRPHREQAFSRKTPLLQLHVRVIGRFIQFAHLTLSSP
jgi:hypothetical protein